MTDDAPFSPLFREPDHETQEAELIARMELAQSARYLLENAAVARTFKELWNMQMFRLLAPIDPEEPEKSKALIFQARLELDALQNMFNRLATLHQDGREVASELRELQRQGRSPLLGRVVQTCNQDSSSE